MVTKEITISDKFKFTFAWEYFSQISKVFYLFLWEKRMMPSELIVKNLIKKKSEIHDKQSTILITTGVPMRDARCETSSFLKINK